VDGPTPTHSLHTNLAHKRRPNGEGQGHYRALADDAEPFNIANLVRQSRFPPDGPRRGPELVVYATTTTWGGCVPWLVSNAAVFVDVVVASNE
jgi:hypothetical protein